MVLSKAAVHSNVSHQMDLETGACAVVSSDVAFLLIFLNNFCCFSNARPSPPKRPPRCENLSIIIQFEITSDSWYSSRSIRSESKTNPRHEFDTFLFCKQSHVTICFVVVTGSCDWLMQSVIETWDRTTNSSNGGIRMKRLSECAVDQWKVKGFGGSPSRNWNFRPSPNSADTFRN